MLLSNIKYIRLTQAINMTGNVWFTPKTALVNRCGMFPPTHPSFSFPFLLHTLSEKQQQHSRPIRRSLQAIKCSMKLAGMIHSKPLWKPTKPRQKHSPQIVHNFSSALARTALVFREHFKVFSLVPSLIIFQQCFAPPPRSLSLCLLHLPSEKSDGLCNVVIS